MFRQVKGCSVWVRRLNTPTLELRQNKAKRSYLRDPED